MTLNYWYTLQGKGIFEISMFTPHNMESTMTSLSKMLLKGYNSITS